MDTFNFDKALFISDLIAKFTAGSLTDSELTELESWVSASDENKSLFEELTGDQNVGEALLVYKKYNTANAFVKIGLDNSDTDLKGDTGAVSDTGKLLILKPNYRKWWAAAAIIAVLSTGAYFLTAEDKNPQERLALKASSITAGKEGAILTLADGSVIVLDGKDNGVIAKEGNNEVRLANGQLAYVGAKSGDQLTGANPLLYNTLSTPKGRQFQVSLPDGSKAWLNAASSIKFPTSFTGSQRKVEISGEVYFEVATEKNKPFVVYADRQIVEVLGTSFNVNAYDDEPQVITTLIQGSVNVKPKKITAQTSNSKGIIMTPGHQSTIHKSNNPAENNIIVEKVNAEQAIAWKNGVFNFHHIKFDVAIRQIARWYDINVVFKNGVPDVEFWGKVGRDLNLDEILIFMQRSDINFNFNEKNKTLEIL